MKTTKFYNALIVIAVLIIALTCPPAYAQTNNGLLLWWSFDDGSGTSAADSSGNGYTGTLTNSPTWVTGRFGDALTFNGSSNYVAYTASSTVADNLANFTVAAWFKTNSNQGNGSSCNSIVSKEGSGTGGWQLGMGQSTCNTASGQLFALIFNSTNFISPYTTASYADGKWHLVAMVVTGGNTVKLYVDGKIPAESSSSAGTMGSYSNTDDVRVGDDYASQDFNGTVDEVRIYNRALSAGEIYELFENGAGTHQLGTIF